MKIDHTVIYLKNVADAPTLVPAKDSINANRSVSGKLTETNQASPPSPTLLLPSIHGDFDADRVAGIRASISAGRYQVNTAKIADGLLATVRDLLGRKSP